VYWPKGQKRFSDGYPSALHIAQLDSLIQPISQSVIRFVQKRFPRPLFSIVTVPDNTGRLRRFIAGVDGLKGITDAINAIFPQTIVQSEGFRAGARRRFG
jgi:hypothetical protein